MTLSFLNVGYIYPRSAAPALKEINLEIHGGRSYCVAGADQSGKTTLCKTICGLLIPDSGNVTQPRAPGWGGSQLRGFYMGGDPYDSVVGVTLRDDMEFALRNLGYPSSERRDRIDEMVRFLEIGQIADRPIHTLSGGEQQQIALATGLVMEYSIMVLDESMNMLDHMNRSTLRKTLGVIKNRSGVAIVHATPDPIDLLEADELIFLDRACIAFKGGWLEFAQTEIGRGWFRALGGIWRIIGESASQGIFQTQPKTLEQIREILVNKLMSAGKPPKPLNK